MSSHNTNATGPFVKLPAEQRWNTGLFDITANICPTWAICCCPTAEAMHLGQMCEERQYGVCFNYFALYSICMIVNFTLSAVVCPEVGAVGVIAPCILSTCTKTILRCRIRQDEHIDGNLCTDCLLSLFCGPCVTGQLSRHIYKYTTRNQPLYFNSVGHAIIPPPLSPMDISVQPGNI